MAANFAVATIFTAKDRITQAFKRMGKGADDFGNRVDKAFRKASRSGSRFRDVTKGILAASGIQFGIAQLSDFRREVIETGKQAQALDVVFKTVFGKEAANEMKFVRSEAERLGLQFDVVSKEYSKVAAATKGSNLEGKATRELFIAMSEASVSLQMSADDTAGSLKALTQIISKGKVQAEELRGQLGERLYGAFQKAARAMGVTQAQLNDMLQAGEVVADEFIPKFTKVLRDDFSKSALEASKSFQSMENKFKTAMFDFRVSFGKILLPIMLKFFQVATKITKPIADFIEANSELINQGIDEIFSSIGDVFNELIKVGKESGLFDAIGDSAKELIPLIKNVLKSFSVFIKFASDAGLFDMAATGFRFLAKAIKFVSNALGLILKVIKPIFNGLAWMIRPFARIAGFAVEIAGALTSAAASAMDFSGDDRMTEGEKKAEEQRKKFSEQLRSGQAPNKEVAEARAKAFQVQVGGKLEFANAPPGLGFTPFKGSNMKTSGLGAQ